MRNLLRANFAHLKKEKAFWIGLIGMFAFGLYGVIMRNRGANDAGADFMFFLFPTFMCIVSAAVLSLFFGTEYSDGTIRNKLIAGHTRSAVYLANLITGTAASLLMSLAYLLAVTALGLPLLGAVQMDLRQFAAFLAVALLIVVAYSSILTLLCMANQNKALATVVALLTMLALLAIAGTVFAKLDAPEFLNEMAIGDGGSPVVTQVPNPAYLRGAEREAYQCILDFLPTGQAFSLANMAIVNLSRMALSSIFIVLATTAGGLLYFRKKDLR